MKSRRKQRKKKDFIIDLLERVSNVRSHLFEDKVRITPKEQTGVLLYINAAVISIIVGTLSFLTLLQTPLTDKVKILPLIWIIIGFATIFGADYYLGKRDINALKIMFFITLLHFITASSYFFSGILAFIGTYFVFESKFSKNK